MAVDIGRVTGKTAEINQTNNTMTITGYQSLTKKGRGIVAVYTDDALESVYLSENLAGSDKRGTIYGIYDFCEKIGVSPWYYWAANIEDRGDYENTYTLGMRGVHDGSSAAARMMYRK